jgi:hypothetical protein
MKNIFTILAFFTVCFSCNLTQNSKNHGDDKQAEMNSNASDIKITLIIGKWQICKMITDSIETAYNVCPAIIFAKDGKGRFQSPGGTGAIFQWKIKDTAVTFSFKSEVDKTLFISADTEFSLNFYKDGKIQFVELINSEKKYKYILSRAI